MVIDIKVWYTLRSENWYKRILSTLGSDNWYKRMLCTLEKW